MRRVRSSRLGAFLWRGGAYAHDLRGAAAAEFALWVTLLTVPILSGVDVSFYVYRKMQLVTASEAAGEAAWHLCSTVQQLPATKSCSNLLATMTTAAQSTSLGTSVTVPSASVTEGYYCVNTSGALQLVGSAGTIPNGPTAPSPFTCASVTAGSTTAPGDYLQVTTSYTYAPLFGTVSVVSLLTTPITRTAWMRLN